MNKWLEAHIVEVLTDDGRQIAIKVHFKGYTAKWDETMPTNSDRIKEVGAISKAHGWAKYDA